MRFALDAYERRELEPAVLHACNAVDQKAFALTDSGAPDADGLVKSDIEIVNGAIRLPDLIVMGMCMVAVTAPVNANQQIPPSYRVRWRGERLIIADWRGRDKDLVALIEQFERPRIALDFGEWMASK